MTGEAAALVVNTPNGEIDPLDYGSVTAFKTAVYEYGTGTWLDDLKLSRLYEMAHEREQQGGEPA